MAVSRLGMAVAILATTWSVAALPRADGTSVVEVRTEADAGGTTVRVIFDGPIPEFAVSTTPQGVTLLLHSTALGNGVVVAGGVDARATGRDAVLRWSGASAPLAGVETSAGALLVRIGTSLSRPEPARYRIGVGDVVTVGVFKNPELSGDFPCGADGSLSLPLVGSVRAAGRTESELAVDLAAAYSKYLVEPQLTVAVKTYQSQFVHVTGAVPRATRVALRPGSTVKDVLSEAGVALLPGQRLTVARPGAAPIGLGRDEVESGATPLLRDGDTLTVEEPKYVVIQGEVRRPQRIAMTQGMTLLQAIALAEGLTDWASKREVRILRTTASGQSEELSVDLRRIEVGKDEDPPLEAGDKILVKRRFF